MKLAPNTARLLRNIPLPDEVGEVHCNAAVVDIGTGLTRIGYSGDDAPRMIEQSVYVSAESIAAAARGNAKRGARHAAAPSIGGEAPRAGPLCLGAAYRQRDVVPVSRVLERGLVHDWEGMDSLLGYISTDLLALQKDGGTPLLLTEKALIPRQQREKLAQLLFEHHGVPSLYFALSPVLALYSQGLSTGLSVELGHGSCHAVPVFEGFSLFHAVQQGNFGGDDLSQYLNQAIANTNGFAACLPPSGASQKAPHDSRMQPVFAYDITTYIKERYGMVHPNRSVFLDTNEVSFSCSADGHQGGAATVRTNLIEHVLPDGNVVLIGPERFAVGEAFFDPTIISKHSTRDATSKAALDALVFTEFSSVTADATYGLHSMVMTSAMKCDGDLTPQLLSNVVLSGGSSLTRGLPERLKLELEQLLADPLVSAANTIGGGTRTDDAGGVLPGRVGILAAAERHHAAFVGGSILSSLPTFQDIWVTRADYDESGASAVVRNCF